MKKFILVAALVVALIVAGGYVAYLNYRSEIVASAITAERLPSYIPARLRNKIEAVRTPVNRGSRAMVQEIHRAGIPMKDVYETIDQTTEAQANALLDELNSTPLQNTDQVFDILKKHVPASFDAEVFRKPFNEHFNMAMIRSALQYSNRQSGSLDIETTKEIVKRVLEEKEKELKAVDN